MHVAGGPGAAPSRNVHARPGPVGPRPHATPYLGPRPIKGKRHGNGAHDQAEAGVLAA
ncbi:hypothetical protein BMS3Bbin10_02444 [bacterium BMS3Bbin10]|nr:hypothetical protein BMS3Bbin10_02444 [bacterium BMS3Bbin10]